MLESLCSPVYKMTRIRYGFTVVRLQSSLCFWRPRGSRILLYRDPWVGEPAVRSAVPVSHRDAGSLLKSHLLLLGCMSCVTIFSILVRLACQNLFMHAFLVCLAHLASSLSNAAK